MKDTFNVFCTSNVYFLNIVNIIEFAIWTAERGRLSLTVVKELLNIKANFALLSSKFHDKIKAGKNFLKKFTSAEKYAMNKEDEERDKPSTHYMNLTTLPFTRTNKREYAKSDAVWECRPRDIFKKLRFLGLPCPIRYILGFCSDKLPFSRKKSPKGE